MSKNISNTGLDDEGSKHLIVAKTWFTELSIGKDSHGLAMIYQELTRKIRKSWNFTKVGFRWGSMKVPIRICTLKKRQVLIRVMKGGGRMCKWQPIGPSIHLQIPSNFQQGMKMKRDRCLLKPIGQNPSLSGRNCKCLQATFPQLTLLLQQRFLCKKSKTQIIES